MDYTAHGILQARILEWVAFPFSRGSSQPRDQTQVSHIAGGFFTSWATREAQLLVKYKSKLQWRDFPGGPVVKNLPCYAGDTSSIPGRRTKTPHAPEKLSLCAATRKPVSHNYWAHTLHQTIPHDTTKTICAATTTQCSQINKYFFFKIYDAELPHMGQNVPSLKRSTNNKCWRGYGEKGHFLHCEWECKLVQPQWKQLEVP